MKEVQIIHVKFDLEKLTVDLMDAVIIEVMMDFEKKNCSYFFRLPLVDAMSFFGFENERIALNYMRNLITELKAKDPNGGWDDFPIISIEKTLQRFKSDKKKLKFRYFEN
jgi:hypothetical protein